MSNLSEFGINILSLENKHYEYEYRIDDSFFGNFENNEVKKGMLTCRVHLEKNSSLIRLNFHIEGWIELTCDRSLDRYHQPLQTRGQVIYKFGPEDKEIDDVISIITRDRQDINLAQNIYEFISISVPMKKLHPRYNAKDNLNDEIVYSTAGIRNPGEKKPKTDPRWDILNKLKGNHKE